jgi:NTE family protein
LISDRLAESLTRETGESVVLVRLHESDGSVSYMSPFDGKATAVDWAPSEIMLQGQFGVPSNLLKTEAGFYRLILNVKNGSPAPGSIAALMASLDRHFRHVLVETVADVIEKSALVEFLTEADLAYLFLPPATEPIYRLDQLVREMEREHGPRNGKLKPIVCLAEGEAIDGYDLLIQRIAGPVHLFVRDYPGSPAQPTRDLFARDIRRLAREAGGKLVGLALSSGAAKGFAHIGVIQVLEEHGIEIDVVAGASIGAYIGALWTFGFNGVELEELARELEGRWGFWSLIDPVFPPRRGFLRGQALRRRLMRSIGSARFADLERPLRIVAGNLATLDRSVLASGEIAASVHASMAVPGICVPVTLNGEAFIDGGIVDPVPVEVLQEMGVHRVIAVNAIPTPDRIRYAIQAEKEIARSKDKPIKRWFRKALPLDSQLNYFARGNLFEIVMRSVHGAQVRLAEASCRLADVILRPDICDDRWLDCRNPRRFIALGRESAERQLDSIKALAEGRNQSYEPEFAPETVAAIA